MDIILYNISVSIILLIFGYLMGSIPNAIWIGKVFFGKDPRDYGSGNAGGTNAGRVFGKKVGVIVILLDSLKMIIPLYIAWAILTFVPIYNGRPLLNSMTEIYVEGKNDAIISWPIYWLVAIGVSLGHCFPLYAGFRGGKNVSSSVGILVAAGWLYWLIPALVFLGLLKIKKYVSLSSITGSWTASLISWIWAILIMTGVVKGNMTWLVNYGPLLNCNWVFALVLTLCAIMVTILHRSNIKRLIEGNERKISWMK